MRCIQEQGILINGLDFKASAMGRICFLSLPYLVQNVMPCSAKVCSNQKKGQCITLVAATPYVSYIFILEASSLQ